MPIAASGARPGAYVADLLELLGGLGRQQLQPQDDVVRERLPVVTCRQSLALIRVH